MEMEEYSQIKVSVKHLLNIDLNYYKDEQMRRRLDSWLVRSASSSWRDYLKRLSSEPTELARFRDYLTINVSEFFRDAERWNTLRSTILPELLQAAPRLHPKSGGLRIWSAGCSIGPEPYSLAILLDELSPHQTHYLLATDLDRGALQKARSRGPYSADDIRNVSPQQRADYFEPGGPPFYVKEKVAHRVSFKEHNMVEDPFENEFDLIVCRNVIIYFTNDAKNILYRKFHAALRQGGILFLGGTEIIPHPQEIGFNNHGISFSIKE